MNPVKPLIWNTILLLGIGLFSPGCTGRGAEEAVALQDAKQRMKDSLSTISDALNPSRKAEDIALCKALEDYDGAALEKDRLDSLLKQAKANPNCFCEVEVMYSKHRLLNKIPIVKDFAADYEYAEEYSDPLSLAIATNDWEVVQLLVSSGAHLNGEAGHPNHLNEAISADNLQAVDRLLALGADPKLASLAHVGSIKMSEKMLALGCPAATIGLHAALVARDRKLATYLISKNPKPFGPLQGDRLNLNTKEDWAFIRFLFEQDDAPGVEITWDARSFMMQAIREGDCTIIQGLAQRGLDIRHPDEDESYVRDAVWAKRPEMVECLLALGAPADQPGRNAMESAIQLNSVECIPILLKYKVKVESGSNIEYARTMGADAEVLALLGE